MLKFFTFCVDIDRHTQNNLIRCLNYLIDSIGKQNEFLLICYTNFDIQIDNNNVQFRPYYDNSEKIFDVNSYHGLSRNKIFIYKDLFDEYGDNFIWIDLDTIVTTNLSYLNDYDNFFVTIGGSCNVADHKTQLFVDNNKYMPPYCDYIQGNVWKINTSIYNDILKLERKLFDLNLIPTYDLQCLFNYYAYYENKQNTLNLLGKNCHKNCIYGTSVWDEHNPSFATLEGLYKLQWSNTSLITLAQPNKQIHFLSFTFYSLQDVWNDKKFIDLFS